MRRPGSPSMVTLASRCESVSQNGQPVRLNCQRVPQQPHESRRRAPGIDADQLGHRGQRSARRAIPAKPPLLVAPAVEGVHHGTEEPRHRRPRQITQQPGRRRRERLVAQQEVRRCGARPRARAAAPSSSARASAARRPDDVPEASLSRSAAAIRPPGSRSTAASALDSSGTPARKSAR